MNYDLKVKLRRINQSQAHTINKFIERLQQSGYRVELADLEKFGLLHTVRVRIDRNDYLENVSFSDIFVHIDSKVSKLITQVTTLSPTHSYDVVALQLTLAPTDNSGGS